MCRPVRPVHASKTSWQAVRSSFLSLLAVICLLFLAERSLAMPSADALLGKHPLPNLSASSEYGGGHAPATFLKPGPEGDIPVLVLHGASANLRDPLMGLHEALSGRRVIWLDRPGLGTFASARTDAGARRPKARLIAAFLYQRGHRPTRGLWPAPLLGRGDCHAPRASFWIIPRPVPGGC